MYAWKMDKNIIYWENYLTQREILRQIFKKEWSEIVWYQRAVKEEKTFKKKYSVDTLTDTATVNFACVSSSSQSKKTVLSK